MAETEAGAPIDPWGSPPADATIDPEWAELPSEVIWEADYDEGDKTCDIDDAVDSTTVFHGKVRWFDPKKSYGFIQVDESEIAGDVYVHAKNIEKPKKSGDTPLVVEGQKVTLRIQNPENMTSTGSDRRQAIDVVPGDLPKPKREIKPLQKVSGSCLWFSEEKQFGFLKVDGSDEEIYAHLSEVAGGKALEEGQRCKFSISDRGQKRKAVKVTPGEIPPPDPKYTKQHTGIFTNWYANSKMGWIRPDDGEQNEEIVFYEEALKNKKLDDLIRGHHVKYKLVRRRRNDEAVEIKVGRLPETHSGSVKWFNNEKNFGFISVEQDGSFVKKDVFVNVNDVIGSDEEKQLEPEQRVKFYLFTSREGKEKAIHVIPGAKKPENAEDDEVQEPETTFTPYLPSHFRQRDKLPKDSGSDDTEDLSKEESERRKATNARDYAERARKSANLKKKQRRKRAKEARQKEEEEEEPRKIRKVSGEKEEKKPELFKRVNSKGRRRGGSGKTKKRKTDQAEKDAIEAHFSAGKSEKMAAKSEPKAFYWALYDWVVSWCKKSA